MNAGANTAYLRTPITNDAGGTVTIGAATTNQDNGTADSNSGTLQVLNGGHLSLSGGSTLTTTSTGTLGVTVNGTAGGISGSGGDRCRDLVGGHRRHAYDRHDVHADQRTERNGHLLGLQLRNRLLHGDLPVGHRVY